MKKKRVLVTISISFAVRYIVRTGLLDMMRLYCAPVVAITWNQEDLIAELRAKGYEVYLIPAEERGGAYADVRKKIDIWFEYFCLKSPSTGIQRDYLDQFIPLKGRLLSRGRRIYNRLKLALPGMKKRLFLQEEALLQTATNIGVFLDFIDGLDIEAVFTVTPFHRQEDLLLRASKIRGKKMMTSILSFDNITKRGWIPVLYDLYLLWNADNQQQLYRIYPETKDKVVKVTGAAQFDFYFKPDYLLPKDEWREVVGLNDAGSKKIILYAGGPGPLFPDEPAYLKQIDKAIDAAVIKNAPVVLFRCHPIDRIERWKEAVGDSKNIVFDGSWSGIQQLTCSNISEMDIKKLCSTLAYTDLHINLCSTMAVDGTAFGKPQIGPAYQQNGNSLLLERMYLQEHFAPIVASKGIFLARSQEELFSLINQGLSNPETFTHAKEEVLSSVISNADGGNSNNIAEAIMSYLQL